MKEWTAEMVEWYAENYGEYATNRLAVDALDLPTDANVIDVGCGTGAALRHASQQITEGRLIGIDPVPRMVEIARERAKAHDKGHGIEFRVGPAENLPVEDNFADVVLAFDSYDHWQNKKSGLREIRRVLQADGMLVLVKDGSVPGAGKYAQKMIEAVKQERFSVVKEQDISDEEVQFKLWILSK